MGGAAEFPHRSSSPLKRRASSMDMALDDDGKDDVDMISLPDKQDSESHAEQDSEAVPTMTKSGQSGHGQNGISSRDASDLPLKDGPPPILEQVKKIETLVNAFNDSTKDGQIGYVVSRRWLGRAQARAGPTKEAVDEHPGPIDNADIIQATLKDIDNNEVVQLKAGMGLDNLELFPKEAWDLIVSWYGLVAGQQPIIRVAHDTSTSMIPNVQFELHPPVFKLHRLKSAASGIEIDEETVVSNAPAALFMCSSSVNAQSFLTKIKQRAGIPIARKVRLWAVTNKLPAGDARPSTTTSSALLTPSDSSDNAASLVDSDNPQNAWSDLPLNSTEFMKLEVNVARVKLELEDRTNDKNYNGHSTLAFHSLTVNQTIVLDEQIDRTSWVSTFRPKTTGKDKATASTTATNGKGLSLAAQTRASTSGRNSPAAQGPLTRGRTIQKSGRSVGSVGLGNLGNTCYMNSALQCVRSVEELTKYFLVHASQDEINHDNPLGHGGQVAIAFNNLLNEIYKEPAPPSVLPRQFKNTVGRFAPQFSGYGQQDSQEFLGFLLDGLQEDLSRVAKKPYIEKPESTDDMINNDAAIREMADKVWDITKRRDDSVIADLFTGLYKSTLICPKCQKVSITFDPFNNLTLPLPIQNVWNKEVKYYPLNDAPVRIEVEVDKSNSIKAMKEFISARVGVPVERLFAAEEWKEKFFKMYEDYQCISEEIQSSDIVVVYEVEAPPTNLARVSKKKARSMLDINDDEEPGQPWDSPLAERLVVPVLHRFEPKEMAQRRRMAGHLPAVTPPHVIILTPEEARSEDAIRRKILEKVASFSTWEEFSRCDDSETADNTDTDLVHTTVSDADSAGDSKVIAKSVEGEDDIVDVTMKDANDSKSTSASSKLLKKFNSQRPKWVDRHEFLSPELQNLFSISYFSEPGVMIPVGWSSTSDDRLYPRIEERLPAVEEEASPSAWTNGAGSDNDSSQEELPASTVSNMTRMADESDEEFPPVKELMVNDTGLNKVGPGGRKNRHLKTHNKKGIQRRQKRLQRASRQKQQQSPSPSDPPNTVDNGPLIRLGEGILVDWNPAAWSMVYGKAETDTVGGTPTFDEPLQKLEDPALMTKQRTRQQRRRTGLTLDECLDEFEKDEILSENDTWYCPRCKEHQRASKKFDLWKTPDILVIHLKRFSSSGWRRDKLDTRVDFPVEGLDLTRRVLDKQSGKEEVYDLIAVDDHWGGLGGGHYTAFARNFVDGEWYEFNDSSVSRVKEPEQVVSAAAYLLFYRRRSSVPLGGPRFQSIIDKYDSEATSSDEEMSESGEDRRLDIVSSRLGSSSALKGAGAGAALPQGGHSSASSTALITLGAGADRDYLPSYQQASGDSGDTEDDSEPPMGAGILNFGSRSIQNNAHIRQSIEQDEGIGMTTQGHGWPKQNWTFESVDLGDKAPRSIASHDGRNSSATDVDSLAPAVGFQDEKMGFDTPEEYGESLAAQELDSYQLPPAPDSLNQANMDEIREQMWQNKTVHEVLPQDDDQASDKAVDIHISEDDAKMD